MNTKNYTAAVLVKFIMFAALGIFMFFVPVTMNGVNSIPLDHMVNVIKKIPNYFTVFGVSIFLGGIAYSFFSGTWKKTTSSKVFFILKLTGIIFMTMYLTGNGPDRFMEDDMLPFIWDKIMVPVATIVPVGSIFLAFITNFGLMEFFGVLLEKVMRPIWKTPGRSAVDAVASFVGSYSLALLITNRVYLGKKYTAKEATIIATGFSTVSATFMVIVANALGIMNHWLLYFTLTAVITFIVTAITARIYPLSKMPDKYVDGTPRCVEKQKPITLSRALSEGMEAFHAAPGVGKVVFDNFINGFRMSLNIAPSILAIGMLGLIIAEYTPVFSVIGYIFYPFTVLTQTPDALLSAKAVSTSIAEMMLPAAFVVDTPVITRFMVGIVSVSEILFFSASIPCIMGTAIPLTIKDYIIIWIERVILSILIAMPILHLIF
ncbi:YjiH family protein [Thermoactinomyces mirandus]|uniref:YjiH family protein n=1 Tax=Thermoactinomyces mirandus TaxID=2756294 RepID=A0A7W2ARE6_9BACL|nr:YjiH family protein [Thermoactinomyces mirandus]MBA4602483.1 YjiH family protein [Thermoactinomyces mirandus]